MLLNQELVSIADVAFTSAALRAGEHLACRPGCFQCCIGVFPIAQLDAERLREGLLILGETNPSQADRIRLRTASSLAMIDPWFPGDRVSGVLSDDYEAATLFEEFANDEPCPVLDPSTGTCDLYSTRPILCRTFGPPLRMEDSNLGTCELCFVNASAEEIVGCELDPLVISHQNTINAAFDKANNRHGETLVAYALRGV